MTDWQEQAQTPQFVLRMDRLMRRLRRPTVRAQMDIERQAATVYREMAEELRARIERLAPTDLENRRRLQGLRQTTVRLLAGTSRELEALTRKAWRTAARESIDKNVLALSRMSGISGIDFEISADENREFIRQTVRYLSDPLTQGLSLSDRVWRSQSHIPSDVMRQISFGTIEGEGTAEIGRRVKQFLADPEGSAKQAGVVEGLRTRARKARDKGDTARAKRLFARARELEIRLPSPGIGTYRSPPKNAERVVRGAFKQAELHGVTEYARSKDWAVGIGWRLSASHPEPDICDGLVGIYRKNEVPDIPHPQCLCYWIPIPAQRFTGERVRFRQAPPQNVKISLAVA